VLLPEQIYLLNQFVDAHRGVDPSAGLTDVQRALYGSPAKRKVAVCGRRGGKTTVLNRLLHQAAEANPRQGEDESIIVYIAPTRGQAKRLMWGRLQVTADALGMQYEYNSTELIARHQNGSEIWLMGANDDRDVARLRGFAYRRVVIDEAQAVGATFEDLIDEVLEPALEDWQGDLILAGTPHASCRGYLHDASTGALPGWEAYHWTVLDNRMFPAWRNELDDWKQKAQQWLERLLKRKGWDDHHPTYLREWMGRWVRDDTGLVYHYDRQRNGYDGRIPEGYAWRHVLGVDLGHDDAFAMCVWAMSDDLPDTYQVAEYKRSGLTVSQWAELIKDWQDKYQPVKTVVDTGGLGKAIVEEMRSRHGLTLHAAEKKNKADYIEILNSDFHAARAWLLRDGMLAREMELIQWDEDHKREDPRYPNDLADAALYGWRESKHWTYEPPDDIPTPEDEDYADHVARELRRMRAKKIRRTRRWPN